MECTQRLECTQEVYGTQHERINPEQIGFLGILGNKYPIYKGPNKIGRDPQTCSIILNLNSVSRQHAVINVLNKKDFMLMDLDSANKTKHSGKVLKPYIPHPIYDGDTVQFGEIFGVFRLLEDDNDLPMTQALDIPDTPVALKHVSRVNAITTIPESPDVSDKDDSFIVPSQPNKGLHLKSKTQHYIKPGKTISIQPIGSNKIDNIFWNSSKKSTSFNLDDSGKSFNVSTTSVRLNEKENINANEIHELETQQFLPQQNDDSPESIYCANTQLPGLEGGSINTVNTQLPGSPSTRSLNVSLADRISSPSIHSLNTQMPVACSSPSIHNLETQAPGVLPDVCKVNDQHEIKVDLIAKENDIYECDTQEFLIDKKNSTSPNSARTSVKDISKVNVSDEEMFFDVVDNGPIEQLESQAILTEDIDLPINKALNESEPMSQLIKPKCTKRNMRIESDDGTDCEADVDIIPSQVIPKLAEDDETDCEDTTETTVQKQGNQISKDNFDADATQDLDFDYYNAPPMNSPKNNIDLEDMPTQVLHNEVVDKVTNNPPRKDEKISSKEIDIENIATQVLNNENIEIVQTSAANKDNVPPKVQEFDIEDVATQVLPNENVERLIQNPIANIDNIGQENELDIEDMPTQVLCNDTIEKTCVLQTPIRKEVPKHINFENLATQVLEDPNEKYQNNQFSEEIVISPFKVPWNSAKPKKKEKILKLKSDLSKSVVGEANYYQCTQDVLEDLCTQDMGSPKINIKPNKGEDINKSVSKLSMKEIREVIGVNSPVAKVVKCPSDGSNSSDLEVTPKKTRLIKVMNIDLPNSQEIKTGVSFTSKSQVTESSSDSESEKNVEEQNTPIVHRRTKKRSVPSGVLNVTKKLDIENLPRRVLTRPRKPTAKFQEAQNILKPTYLTGSQEDLDVEIITENITRLKNEKEKSKMKNNKESNQTIKDDPTKKQIDEIVKTDVKTSKKSEKNIEDKVENEKPESKSKNNRRNKKEPNNNKKERTSKNSNSSREVTKLDSTVESNKTRISIKSLDNISRIVDISETISPIRTRSKRAIRSANSTKTEDQSRNKETSKTESDHSRSDKRKRTKKRDKSPSPAKEVRRSRRQKPKEPVKSILKKETLEQSAVYNNSGSNSDSPRSLKRPALEDCEEPSSKRLRQNNLSLRLTPARLARTHYVLFTAFPADEVKDKLEEMGAVIVTDVTKCTVLLTLQVKRTFKLLCAVGLGKPIVGPNWVQACADNKTIVDPWLYIIRDEVAEKRFNFSLQQTLVGRRSFLHGYNVSSTPSVMPNQTEMKLIVECSGGTWREGGTKWICVTCSSDRHLWPALNKLGATLVTTELILGGVLRQKLEIESNKVQFAK